MGTGGARSSRHLHLGPQYHHPEWHNEGDSARLLPTITEWWEHEDQHDSVAIATRNQDSYLQYRRINEITQRLTDAATEMSKKQQ